MTSAEQTAANRSNAKMSSGPRSASGKRRSSKNSLRHGLSVPLSAIEFRAQVAELALQIAGETDDTEVLALAEQAALAQLEMRRVRLVQKSIVEQALMKTPAAEKNSGPDGTAEFQEPIVHIELEQRSPNSMNHQSSFDLKMLGFEPGDLEDDGFAEAFRPILPELERIERYAKRAAGRRDAAISKMMKARKRHPVPAVRM